MTETTTTKYTVTVLRTERILFEVTARNADDAASRYLLDGNERSSETVTLDVEAVALTADPLKRYARESLFSLRNRLSRLGEDVHAAAAGRLARGVDDGALTIAEAADTLRTMRCPQVIRPYLESTAAHLTQIVETGDPQ